MNVAASPRRRWSLQTRLIVTVVSFVSLILIAVALATGTILGSILRENLDAQVRDIKVRVGPLESAASALDAGPQQDRGSLLVIRNLSGTTGAYVDGDGTVRELTDVQVDGIVDDNGVGIADGPSHADTVTVPDLGEYRVQTQSDPSGLFAIVGMPTSEVTATMGRILTTVALLTVGGLILLAIVVAVVIRHSLRPLRAVATTATRVAAQPLSQGDVTIRDRVPADEADDRTEIGRVGAALNTLLDHVDASLSARQRNEERMRAFVADASHELRTPLASIRGYSELSLRGIRQQRTVATDTDTTAAATEQALERIQAQSLRMTTLVEDLLLLARLDEGTELVYATVDLTRLAIDAVADAQAARPDHEWVIDVGEQPVVVAADAARLQQVAVNLLANAGTHTPAGTRVTTTVAVEGTGAVMRIHDDGPGIDPAVADALFERFARADVSRARRTGGTGLGLSIVKAIVDAHHGTIAVTSEPGSTTFEVRLPARPAAPTGA